MVGVGFVRERRLVVWTEAGAVVGGGLVVTVAVVGGLDVLLAQVGHEKAHHCKRGADYYTTFYPSGGITGQPSQEEESLGYQVDGEGVADEVKSLRLVQQAGLLGLLHQAVVSGQHQLLVVQQNIFYTF